MLRVVGAITIRLASVSPFNVNGVKSFAVDAVIGSVEMRKSSERLERIPVLCFQSRSHCILSFYVELEAIRDFHN
jgi:hypothetical protein